jgi:hypothetical protein
MANTGLLLGQAGHCNQRPTINFMIAVDRLWVE